MKKALSKIFCTIPRSQKKFPYTKALASLALGFLAAGILVFYFSSYSFAAVIDFFLSPFSSVFFFGSMLASMSLLLVGSLGSSVALLSGNYNLGGEGQVYLGGLITALILSKLDIFFAPLLAIILVIIVSALLSFIPIILKLYRGASELLTSFLLSAALIPLIDWAIAIPLRNKGQNLLATSPILARFEMTKILPPSSLSIVFFLSILLVFIAWRILYRTKEGELFRISGKAEEFSLYAGFKTKRYNIIAMSISGALHGLVGYIAVVSIHHTCHSGFYLGLGWNALSVALIAKSYPLLLIPASFILAYLFSASDYAVLFYSMPFNASFLIQGIVLFAIAASHIGGKKNG